MSVSGIRMGDSVTCHIEKLVYGGAGLARVDGRVLFVPGTAPDETVRARVTSLKRGFARAELQDVLEASPARREPCCRVEDPDTGATCQVPGCVYDHLDYAAEVAAKQRQLEEFLARLTRPDPPPLLSPYAAPQPLHYRNKIVLHAVRGQKDRAVRLGYRLEPSHRVLDISVCPLACDPINQALSALRTSAALSTFPHDSHATFRYTPHDGVVWWLDRRPPSPPGPDLLTESSPVGPLFVPRDGFYQINTAVGDALVRTVAAWFADSPRLSHVLDLYCGVGVFGFACMTAGGARLTGVESGRTAVAAALRNATALGLPATFLCQALGQDDVSLPALLADPDQTTAVVDPPREGLSADIAQGLAASGIARIFYVSCDPATLSRDLAILLASGGYRLARAQLFAMFPRTAHFETLVELLRS